MKQILCITILLTTACYAGNQFAGYAYSSNNPEVQTQIDACKREHGKNQAALDDCIERLEQQYPGQIKRMKRIRAQPVEKIQVQEWYQ